MKSLDDLLEGISRLALEIQTDRPMDNKEISEYNHNEHKIIEEQIKRGILQLKKVHKRKDYVLRLYDSLILQGYDAQMATRMKKHIDSTCIPCFTNIPKDKPEYIQLLYASIRPNKRNSISFGELISKSSEVSGKDANIFFYELRRRFSEDLNSGLQDYGRLSRSQLPKRPWDDDQYDLYWNKKSLIDTIDRTLNQYQLIIHLIYQKRRGKNNSTA